MIDTIAQSYILFSGLLGAGMIGLSMNHRVNMWGFFIALTGQPFWIYINSSPEQFGEFSLALYYTFIWGIGFYKRWRTR